MKSAWIEKTNSSWIRALLADGQLLCMACVKANSRSGMFKAISGREDVHAGSQTHSKHVAEFNAAQARIDAMMGGVGAHGPALLERSRAEVKHGREALVTASFLAGGAGAAGLPPFSLPVYLRKDVLGLLEQLQGGLPAASTLSQTTIPNAVKLVEERILAKLRGGMQISMFIDGGAAKHLAGGRKVVVVCADSREWGEPLLLDVTILECHESSDTQTAQIERICIK